MAQNQVYLSIGGRDFYGWINVSVAMAVLSIARTFKVSLTAKSSEQEGKQFEIKSRDEVVVRIGDDVVLTGYVVKVSESYSGTTHQLEIEGASKTVDLVDCCIPDGKPLSYKKRTALEILQTITSYYGIETIGFIPKTDKVDFDISPEEKIKEGLDKFLKKHNLLLTDDPVGRLVLARVGDGRYCYDRIELGVNVLSASRTFDSSGLYSRYVIVGQGTNPLSERPVTDNQLKRVAEDPSIRYRVRVDVQSGNAIGTEMQNRVVAIRDFSAATAEKLSYVVQGWRQSNGELWPINSFVTVKDSKLRVSKEYLITKVTFSLDSKGMTTKLELQQPEAFVNTNQTNAQAAVKQTNLKKIGQVGQATWTQS